MDRFLGGTVSLVAMAGFFVGLPHPILTERMPVAAVLYLVPTLLLLVAAWRRPFARAHAR